MSRRIIIAAGGSSGSIYTKLLMDAIQQHKHSIDKTGVVMTKNAKLNWELELKDKSYNDYSFDFYENDDFFAPFASGSAKYDTMIICPCSMGLLARISQGISNDLITRAADVVLKERRKLIIVPRETPFNLIHLNNMKALTEAGAIICPAVPSFYSGPTDIETLCKTVTDRILDLANIDNNGYRWQEK